MSRARRSVSPLAALGAAAIFVLGLSIPASAAVGTTVYVVPGDFSSTNVSSTSTRWDAPALASAMVAPTGVKWALDIENKPIGTWAITAEGLEYTVDVLPLPGANPPTAAPKKVRFQYYLGSNGYTTIDSTQTLSQLFDSPISWDLKLLSGDRTTYGPVLQIQLQKKLPTGDYARVTVSSVWSPADGTHDLLGGLWFSNTNIYAAGYGTTPTTYASLGTPTASPANGGPGVTADILETNFGDFEVVSFGPNLGRDFAYGYAFQNLTISGHTFTFVVTAPAVPTPPPAAGTTTTPVTTSRTTTSNGDQLTTFALPTATPTPSPSQSDEPAPPSADGDEADGDGVVIADQPTDVDGFPAWILILGIGFLVLLLAFIFWFLRRRTA